MANGRLLVFGESRSISSELSQRLEEKLEQFGPAAISNLRGVAAHALSNGRLQDATLANLEADETEKIAKQKGVLH